LVSYFLSLAVSNQSAMPQLAPNCSEWMAALFFLV
jgi:hypothetical protein